MPCRRRPRANRRGAADLFRGHGMSLPAPAYQSDRVTVYMGDCLKIMPHLPKVDVVVTDPPYGVSGQQNTKTAKRRGGRKNDYVSFVDSWEYVESVAVKAIAFYIFAGYRVVITPGNRCLTLYPAPDSFGSIYQPASVGLQPWGRADSQPILYYGKSPHGGRKLPGQKCSYQSTEAPPSDAGPHPCPKPMKLWMQLVKAAANPGETILDMFAGSGTTGLAAIKLGCRAILIEIEQQYIDIICRRVEAEEAQGILF